MTKKILLMTCALGALGLTGQAAYAAEASSGTAIGEVVVTAERRETSLQSTPIAVSAFSGAALTARKLDGGQNLVLQVPNSNYTRSNFGGFNLKIRGVGVDVITFGGTSGVSINENELPVSDSNFANSEFFDAQRVEVLRGPQGTLYGRNAVGGAVNIITNQPSDTFGGFATVSYGNFKAIKVSGAVNIPLGEALALRVAGIRLVQDGFGNNIHLNQRVDGRDLGAIRATLRFKPSDRFEATLMFEHYGEDDNRNRVGKQLCIKDPGPTSVGGVPIAPAGGPIASNYASYLNQGCIPGSLYQDAAYGSVNSLGTSFSLANFLGLNNGTDVFANHPLQNHNLHDIESVIQPTFTSQEDLVELKMKYHITDNLTLQSITGFNQAHGTSEEDYNRLVPLIPYTPVATTLFGPLPLFAFPNGVVPDKQVGDSNLYAAFDYGTAQAKEYTQEIRLSSSFKGPFNFSIGGFYSEHTTLPNSGNYYVMSNVLTGAAYLSNRAGGALSGGQQIHVDTINRIPDGSGHNYYDARNGGQSLKSTAVFGEVYVEFTPELKLTLGGRYTEDKLHNVNYPIGLLVGANANDPLFANTSSNPFLPNGGGGGFPSSSCTAADAASNTPCLLDQNVKYKEFTGRANLDWTPHLSFTDKTLVYISYSRGYKGGGFNTPCQLSLGGTGGCPYPIAFAPEFINAYEAGTKNTLAGGTLQLNLTGFYYDYKGYQISTIVAKSSVNENINTKIYGLEFESIFSPVHNLAFNANVGFLHTRIDNGQSSVDQMDLTAGNPNFTLIHDVGAANCLAPTAAVAGYIALGFPAYGLPGLCDPSTAAAKGFGITSNPNRFGIAKNIGGNKMPNSPDFTVTLGAQYTLDLANEWRATPRVDFYWQDKSYARIYNAVNDLLQAYHNVNATLTFANAPMGIDVQFWVKNAFNAQPLTGVYLTNDGSGLFQNVFTLEPRTFGAQLTKKF